MLDDSADSSALPLVSCLCVTRKRPAKLRRAIDCYLAQSYPNKELVILVEDDDTETLSFLERCEHQERLSVHLVPAVPKLTLGQLRNASIYVCEGALFCQWDDDDWYHAERLTAQVAAVTKAHQSATFLTHWFIFDASTAKAYFSPQRLWEGSILCKKSLITDKLGYPTLDRMEDAFFVNALVANAGVYPLAAPSLYIYEIHSSNTWNREHFELLLAMSQPLSQETSQLIAEIMDGRVSVEDGSRRMDSSAVLEQVRAKLFQSDPGRAGKRSADVMPKVATLGGLPEHAGNRSVGPVPAFKARARYWLGSGWYLASEVDGFYAPVKFLNGGKSDVVGAVIDASVRAGYQLSPRATGFLNLRWFGGGAEGTGDAKDFGDGYTQNWLQLLSVSLGVEFAVL